MEEEFKEVNKGIFNYQYPKSKLKKEKFVVVLIGKNFLILNDENGNNLRVQTLSSNLYSINEKIYKEDGKFSWEKG